MLWSYFPDGLTNVLDVAPNDAYTTAFLRDNPDDTAVGNFLEKELFKVRGNASALRKLVAILKAPRFKDSSAATMASMFDPDRPFATGKPMPEFAFASIPDQPGTASKTITTKTMAGQVYLVDIWATWCGPCLASMPRIHELYGKYSRGKIGKKLAILSVSLDATADKVVKFRTDKEHPMPWTNALSNEAVLEKLTGGVKSIPVPTMVLVDDRGVIVGSTPDINDESLPKLLDQLLK